MTQQYISIICIPRSQIKISRCQSLPQTTKTRSSNIHLNLSVEYLRIMLFCPKLHEQGYIFCNRVPLTDYITDNCNQLSNLTRLQFCIIKPWPNLVLLLNSCNQLSNPTRLQTLAKANITFKFVPVCMHLCIAYDTIPCTL